jgi:RHS repeat-associated protein
VTYHDVSGNMTNDGLNNSMVYDAENRLVSINSGSATYSYDGKSLRVKKVASATTTVYIFSGTRVIAEYQNGAAPGSPTREYIYSGGALLAKVESGAVQYYHPDQLSARLMTDSNGNVIGQEAHYPFGESWYQTNTTTKWLFTDYERDAESGNDYATFRYKTNRFGRFASPDPIAGSRSDPQSLNRYAYVLDDPVNLVDPLGLDSSIGGQCGLPDWEECGASGGGYGQVSPAYEGPDPVVVDGIQVDPSVAQAILAAGFGYVCPVSDCSGATVTTAGGLTSTRVPNCADPNVEDCGYSDYLAVGNSGAVGLTGAGPGYDNSPGGRISCAGVFFVFRSYCQKLVHKANLDTDKGIFEATRSALFNLENPGAVELAEINRLEQVNLMIDAVALGNDIEGALGRLIELDPAVVVDFKGGGVDAIEGVRDQINAQIDQLLQEANAAAQAQYRR